MMKKTMTVLGAALMLAGVGGGVPLAAVTTPTVAQAAVLNAAKLPNGKYSVPVHIQDGHDNGVRSGTVL